MKFRTKLTLLFVAIALFLTIVGTLFIYYSNLKNLEAQIKNRLEDNAFHIMDKIDRMLFERFSDIKTIASDPDISSRATTPQQITERLIEYRNLHKTYISLSFFDLNRVRTADTAGLDIGKQHSLGPYWERVLKNEAFIMEISKSESLQNVLFHFVSLVKNRNGFPLGVVVSRMPVERLYDIVGETLLLREGEEEIKIDLVDKNGLLIYSTYNRQGILKDRFEEWGSLRSSFPGEKGGIVRHFHSGKEEYIHIVAKEQGHLDFKGNGWTLHIQIPIKTALAPVVELRNKIIAVGSGIILFSIVIILFFSGTISQPIIRLRDAAVEIGKGNLGVKVDITSKDEIGQLAASFNTMVENLKSNRDQLLAYSSELETKISERTAELQDINKQLRVELVERKKAEEALRRSKEFSEVVFNSMNDAISVIDAHHFKIIDVNRIFLDNLGAKKEEVIGKTCHEITHHRSEPCIPPDDICPLLEVLKTGKPSVAEHVHYRKDGEKTYIEISASPVKDEKGRVFQVIHVARDITDRKKAEEEREKLIQELQKALAEVKTLSGLIPICASCKKIRDDKGYWNQIESYIRDHSEAEFSHGICPECMKKLYPDLMEDDLK